MTKNRFGKRNFDTLYWKPYILELMFIRHFLSELAEESFS